MTIEAFGHVESMTVGPVGKIVVIIRLESARSQVLVEVLATKDELASLYYPGKPITMRITPNP
jgi:hypothetical protein